MRLKTYFLWLLIFFTRISQAATLVVLDVGEGQAVLLKDGEDAILVDTGHAGAAPAVLESLAKYDVTALKAIVLTHLHPDHASGWFRVHEAFPKTPTFYSGHRIPPLALDDVSRWVFDAITSDSNYREIKMGDSISVGRCTADIIWPKDPSGLNLNANSMVLAVTCGGATALLMADANADVERTLLQKGKVSENVGILVVGHHGASDATSMAFLAKTRPKYSVISVNKNNIRGYPADTTIKSLEESGSTIFRTDHHGEICFQMGEGGLKIPCLNIREFQPAPDHVNVPVSHFPDK